MQDFFHQQYDLDTVVKNHGDHFRPLSRVGLDYKWIVTPLTNHLLSGDDSPRSYEDILHIGVPLGYLDVETLEIF